MITGSPVIFFSAGIGPPAHGRRKLEGKPPSARSLYPDGLAVPLVTLAFLLSLRAIVFAGRMRVRVPIASLQE
ncbi:MAG: hypothetical protein M1337_02430 [Actinobacteria bacterium]|nr:hypothetical protein [Actinomycetota bacterium]